MVYKRKMENRMMLKLTTLHTPFPNNQDRNSRKLPEMTENSLKFPKTPACLLPLALGKLDLTGARK
jgi:hypothetical protein